MNFSCKKIKKYYSSNTITFERSLIFLQFFIKKDIIALFTTFFLTRFTSMIIFLSLMLVGIYFPLQSMEQTAQPTPGQSLFCLPRTIPTLSGIILRQAAIRTLPTDAQEDIPSDDPRKPWIAIRKFVTQKNDKGQFVYDHYQSTLSYSDGMRIRPLALDFLL